MTTNQIFYEGATYPSPHLAPIRIPYLIYLAWEAIPGIDVKEYGNAMCCRWSFIDDPSYNFNDWYNHLTTEKQKLTMAEVWIYDKIVGLRGERKPPVSTVGIANPLGE